MSNFGVFRMTLEEQLLLIRTRYGLFQEKTKQRRLRIYCFETPLEFFNFPLEIPDKTKPHPWKFKKTFLEPLEIPRPKTKILANYALFFIGHTWKFHFVLN